MAAGLWVSGGSHIYGGSPSYIRGEEKGLEFRVEYGMRGPQAQDLRVWNDLKSDVATAKPLGAGVHV